MARKATEEQYICNLTTNIGRSTVPVGMARGHEDAKLKAIMTVSELVKNDPNIQTVILAVHPADSRNDLVQSPHRDRHEILRCAHTIAAAHHFFNPSTAEIPAMHLMPETNETVAVVATVA